MRVAFRADASIDIGTGHVMRCLALASELHVIGDEIHFICRKHQGHLIGAIEAAGFNCHTLPEIEACPDVLGEELCDASSHTVWLDRNWIADAESTASIVFSILADLVVVDHYSLDARWEREVAKVVERIMVIDDLADRLHDCTLLLDQNLGRKSVDYESLVPQHCQMLLGPRYALLRPEFEALREYSLERRSTQALRRVFISMGGIDKGNTTRDVLAALKVSKLPVSCDLVVVMAGHSPGLSEVMELIEEMPYHVELRSDVTDIGHLMAECDLAIGAAGITAWERCCLGLPSIVIIIAENQRPGGLSLAEHGAAMLVESPADISHCLTGAVDTLVAFPRKLYELSENAKKVTDGFGVKRVSGAIHSSGGNFAAS